MSAAQTRHAPLKRWWRSPWLPTAAALVPAAVRLWSATVPGGYFFEALAALACWLVVCMIWLVVAVVATLALPLPRMRHAGTLWPLLTMPALAVASFALAGSGTVERAVFETHRAGLEQLVADVAAAPDQQVTDVRVGVYSVSSAHRSGDCTTIALRGAGFLDTTGYAYCPGPPPIDDVRGGEGTTYHLVDGGWYVFTFMW